MLEAAAAGADIIEVGIPWSDPSADGKVIQAAVHRARARGGGLRRSLALCRSLREANPDVGLVLFGYANPIVVMGPDAFAACRAQRGRRRRALRRLSPRRRSRAPDGAGSPRARLHPAARADFDAGAGRGGREGGAWFHLLRLAHRHHRHGAGGPGRAAEAGGGHQGARRRQHPRGGRVRHRHTWRGALGRPFADGVVVGSAAVDLVDKAVSAGRDPVPELGAFVRSLRGALGPG